MGEHEDGTAPGSVAGARLVTVLGTRPEELQYRIEGGVVRARLAPLAIVCLRSGIGEVVALCTPEAEQDSFPHLREGLPDGVAAELRRITLPTTQADVAEAVRTMAEVMAGQEVVLDLTHGPRHLPMLLFATALYLSALAQVPEQAGPGTQILAAYYGLRGDQSATLVDLKPLVDVARLAFAAERFRRAGDPSALAEWIQEGRFKETEMIAAQLRALAGAYGAGLPLELGREAARFLREYRRRLERWLRREHMPLADTLVATIAAELEALALAEPAVGKQWKSGVRLVREELARQAALIDRLLARGALVPALLLMEEWVVSLALLNSPDADRWLQRQARERAARRLHALRAHWEFPELRERLTNDQQRLAKWWEALSEVRNSLAHAGMRSEEVALWSRDAKVGSLLRQVQQDWSWVKQLRMVPVLGPGVVERILVTPVGRVPGPFFSALHHAAPVEFCVCLCSEETRELVPHVLGRARADPRVEEVLLGDPYRDVGRAKQVAEGVRPLLAQADEVVLNLTGGTTLMGLAVEWIAQEAARLGRKVRRLVVLDRRSRAEQEQDFYVVGEAVWLDGEEA